MSQEKLGEACGYSRVYVGEIERNEKNISIETLEALAEALDVHPGALLVPMA